MPDKRIPRVYFDVFRKSSRFNFRPSKKHSFLSPIEIYIPDRVDTSHHLRMNFTFLWRGGGTPDKCFLKGLF